MDQFVDQFVLFINQNVSDLKVWEAWFLLLSVALGISFGSRGCRK